MHGLEVVVALVLALFVVSVVSNRTKISFAVLLLLGGVLLGTIPDLRDTPLPPEVVLVLFLPALLFNESQSMSLREIRRNIRVIVLNSTLLVALTALAVAATAHAFGMPWGPALVLGAAVAPTDATAMASVALRLPRRFQTTLRAESLINDGTALVLYGIAIDVTARGAHPSGWLITGRFALAYVVGAAVGVAVALLAGQARRIARKPILENVVSVAAPFVAYLPAERLHGSGVVSVVACGLVLSHTAPRHVPAMTRLQARAFWQVATFVLNGALFLLVGLQVYPIVDGLGTQDVWPVLRDSLAILGVVIGVRIAVSFTLVYVVRTVDRRAIQRTLRVGARQRLVMAWAGPRGAISLAAALAVPTMTDAGAPFPDRNVIVFSAFVVIIGTLVIQGSTLGPVARWGRLPEDGAEDDEIHMAEKRMGEAARAAVASTARGLDSPSEVVDRLQRNYQEVKRDDEDDYRALQMALLEVKRNELVRLRDSQEIDDIVLRRLEVRLDREETAITSRDEDV